MSFTKIVIKDEDEACEEALEESVANQLQATGVLISEVNQLDHQDYDQTLSKVQKSN